MKGELVILIFLILAIALSGCLNPDTCGDGVCGRNENSLKCPADCGPPPCIEEGEAGIEGMNSCCEGLSTVGACEEIDGVCTCSDGFFICSQCGDRRCGLGENVCNCEKDCPVEV